MNYLELNSDTVYVYVQTYQFEKKYLLRALNSIKKQTYTNFRCLVYDNCSNMDIRNRLREYVKSDSRFCMTYFDKTEGHIISWEYGIPEILHLAGERGGFYCRVDADDELEPDCFEKMVSYMKNNDLDMVASGTTFVAADTGNIIGVRNIQTNVILESDLFEKKFPEYYQIMRTHWGKVFKIEILKKMNLSNLNITPYGSDTLFVREALLHSKRVGIMPELLYKYYVYSDPKVYNMREGRLISPKVLLERDLSFIVQKCGSISMDTIAWLINIYLCENEDVFRLIVNDSKDIRQKVEDMYSVLSSIPCRMAIRLGAGGRYTALCDWLIQQDILKDEQIFNRCSEIFGILCTIPKRIPNGDNADYFRFLIKLYDFWDDYHSKGEVEKRILECVRKSLLLQNSDFYYCKFNADIVELLLRENYKDAYKKIKDAIQKKDYFEKQFIKYNIELGQNVAAVLQNEAEFVYMNKRKLELLMEESPQEALAEVEEWIQILPGDKELMDLKQSIIERI